MKKKLRKVIVKILSLCMIVCLFSCDSWEMKEYYSQKENYIEATGTLVHFKYNKNRTEIFLGFSDTTVTFDDYSFIIAGKSVQHVIDEGIKDKLKMGARVNFTVAPKYFGDGYAIPIVALSLGSEVILDFDTGYENLMEWLD